VHHFKFAHSAFNLCSYLNFGFVGVFCADPNNAEHKGGVGTRVALLHPLFYFRRLVTSTAHSLVLGVVRVSFNRDVVLDLNCSCSHGIDGLAITLLPHSFGVSIDVLVLSAEHTHALSPLACQWRYALI
jgi:hypothetical protein